MPKPDTSADTPASETPVPVQTVSVAAECLEEMKAQAAKATEHWERYVRTVADLENYKKRAARERLDAVTYANQSLLQKLIPVLDNFEMAIAAAAGNQSVQAGIAMIQTQLKNTLTESGLEEVDAAGKQFDPNFHEAVSQQESANIPEGQVLQQLRKGYKLRDRLLRPATVIVAKKTAA